MKEKRLAAAEMFILSGLKGTNWDKEDDADALRRVAEVASFYVSWPVGNRGHVTVYLEEKRGALVVRVDAKLPKVSAAEAVEASRTIGYVAAIADAVECAIAGA